MLRRVRLLSGAFATAGLLLAISLAVFGLEAHRVYLDVLLWGKGWGELDPYSLWDTSTAYHPLYVFGGLGMPLGIIGVLGVIALTLATRTVEGTEIRRTVFALGVAVVPLLAPSADSHDIVVLLVPAVILLAVEWDRPDGHPVVPVRSILLHLHRYVVELAINPPGWLPLRSFVSGQAAWFQPGMWATFLLVGLAAYSGPRARAMRCPVPARDGRDTNASERAGRRFGWLKRALTNQKGSKGSHRTRFHVIGRRP